MEESRIKAETENILSVKNLSITVTEGKDEFVAVDGASFFVRKGEIVGIVGESGSGKSLTALSLMSLFAPGVKVKSGEAVFYERNLFSMQKEERREIYGSDISMIFQEPMTSLNPLMRIGKQVIEPLKIHKKFSSNKKENDAKIYEIVSSALSRVGLTETERVMKAYPYELSGGMQQRVMIAMACVCSPKLLIADEPTTALDVTTQSQVLELLRKINRENGTAILFISHDIGVIKQFCDRVIVMYSGQIVESGNVSEVLSNPLHEYTKALLSSVPMRKKKGSLLECIGGRVPSVSEKRLPCQFAPRCAKATEKCFRETAKEIILSDNHFVRCYAAEESL